MLVSDRIGSEGLSPALRDAFPGAYRDAYLRAHDRLKGAGYGASVLRAFVSGAPRVASHVGPEQAIAMELFQEVCQANVDFKRVESIVAKDVALSYKLLRFVNTMSPRLEVTISSFRQALVYLGQDKLKMFVSLAVASYIADSKPKELLNLSLQRAQFCQLMSRYQPFQNHTEQAFMIGLFSMLDALLDLSLENLVDQLPLCKVIKVALLRREGPYGVLLALEESFELADWKSIEGYCQQLGLNAEDVQHELVQAQRWSQTMQL